MLFSNLRLRFPIGEYCWLQILPSYPLIKSRSVVLILYEANVMPGSDRDGKW
jgi:hypothetical protein